MNSIADMGGMAGFGAVNAPPTEPVFLEDWERRCFGMFLTSAAAVGFTVDEFRNGMERIDPVHYLTATYYEHWIGGFEHVFSLKGIITKDELDAKVAQLRLESQNAKA